MKHLTSHSLEETCAIAADWLESISSEYSDLDEALAVGLSGHLGSGKTAFVKAIAKKLGIAEEVTSPTFVIMKIYEISSTGKMQLPWKRLVHIDAYRLERREDLDALRFEDVVSDKNNLVMIEWPENAGLTDFSPSAALHFEITEGNHSIHIE